MSHWRDRLRDADGTLASELRAEDAQRLRRNVLAAAAAAARSRRWPLPFALTAASLAIASAALVLSTAIAAPEPRLDESGYRMTAVEGAAPEAPLAESGRRQLYLETPGGTRIIWVFDAEFEVKGTLP